VSRESCPRLVNVRGPIRTEPGGPARRPNPLPGRVDVQIRAWHSPAGGALRGEVPILDATAVVDEEWGAVTLIAVRRDRHGSMPPLSWHPSRLLPATST
jgi:alpha-N-arabinofuranosidase